MKQTRKFQSVGLITGFFSVFPRWIMLFLVTFFICLSYQSFGQCPRWTILSPYGNMTYNRTSGGTYSTGIQTKVGAQLISGSNYNFYRKALSFDVGAIPASSTITSCKINFSSGVPCGDANGTIRFTRLRWDFPTLAMSTVYGLISSGDFITSQAISTESTYSVTLPLLVQDVQNAIQATYKYVGLGAYNEFENSHYGTSFINPVLEVNYTVPTPCAPTGLTTSSVTAVSCVLSWTAPSGNVTGYKVFKNNVLYTTTSSRSVTISGLCPATAYVLRVVAYNTYGDGDNSSNKNVTTLAYSITSASRTVCTSTNSTFTFVNRPAGYGITWTPSSNLVYVSGQGTNNYVVKASSSGGPGTVTATLSTGCNPTVVYAVWAGPPALTVTGPTTGCTNNTYYFASNPVGLYMSESNYSWDLVPLNGNYLSPYNMNKSCAITFYNPYSASGYDVKVRAQNSCGVGNYAVTSIYIRVCTSFMLSPNPASETVTLTKTISGSTDTFSSTAIYDDAATVYTIRIIDYYGSLQYSAKKSGESFSIPIRNLKNGNYIVQVINGTDITNLQLIVKR